MNVTAMMAWFNEDPHTLHRAVTSLQGFADQIIALDGAWNLYPETGHNSPPEQADAIREAARQAGIKPLIYPGRYFTGQVEKRNLMIFLAQNAGATWVMPLDADWELTGRPDHKHAARHELEHTTADTITLPIYTPLNPDTPLHDTAATSWHREVAGTTANEPLIYRVLPGLRVEDYHWFVSAYKNGHRIAMWGCQGRYPKATTTHLKADVLITHHCLFRDERTIQANREYCANRDVYVATHGREP